MVASDIINNISGQIAGVNLSSFLQMIEMDQKTCTIKIFTKKNLGQIFFLNGQLIDASTIHLNGLDAIYDILSWENIVIEVDANNSRRQNKIKTPLMHILMESARFSDEEIPDTIPDRKPHIIPASSKDIPLHILGNKNLKLEVGIRLLIDFEDIEVSFRSTLVGIEYGKYLLIKAPSPFGQKNQNQFKMEGLIIKTLFKGTIYVFRSKMIAVISKPSRLIFIEYPKKIEYHVLRSHKRFKCSIVTQAEVKNKERGGVIENISEGGCLCVLETFPMDKNLTDLIVSQTIPFRCYFPGSNNEVSFLGEIRSAKKKSDEIVVGIKFVYPETKDNTIQKSHNVQQIIKNFIRLIEASTENV